MGSLSRESRRASSSGEEGVGEAEEEAGAGAVMVGEGGGWCVGRVLYAVCLLL